MTTSTQLQLRRGTLAQCVAMTPAAEEPIVDTTNWRIRLGDGSTAGGIPLPNYKDLLSDALTLGTVGGTGNAITLTYSPATVSDSTNAKVEWVAGADNSGITSLQIDGRSVITLKKWKSGVISDLESGDIKTGQRCRAYSNGTYYILDRTDFGNVSTPTGLTYLGQTTGSGASHDFTNYITSTYKDYLFFLDNLLPVSNAVNLLMRVRRSGQGSYDSSSNQYGYSGIMDDIIISASSSVWGGQGSSIALFNTSGLAFNSANSGGGLSGVVRGFGLPDAVRGQFIFDISQPLTVSRALYNVRGGGFRDSASALDSVQFLFSSGNIASGTIRLYGLKAS